MSLFASRNCKSRKVKCGEEKPRCSNCERLDEDCDYKIRLSWGGRPLKKKQLQNGDAHDTSADDLYDGDLPNALRAIQARVLLMPGATDLYFRTADNEAELPYLQHAVLRPIPSIWGHRAGNPVVNPVDLE